MGLDWRAMLVRMEIGGKRMGKGVRKIEVFAKVGCSAIRAFPAHARGNISFSRDKDFCFVLAGWGYSLGFLSF